MTTKQAHRDMHIEGMTCASCVSHVEKALRKTPGVSSAVVNLANETATVDYDPGQTTLETLTQAVRDAGYDVRRETVVFGVQGMTCAACVGHVEKALRKVPGVASVAVNLATERATVVRHQGSAVFEEMRQAVDGAGYALVQLEERSTEDVDAQRKQDELRILLRRLIFSGVAGIFVLLASINVLPGINDLSDQSRFLLLFAVTTPVLVVAGWPIYHAAWSAGRHRAVNMNTLIAVGTLAAYAYSVVGTFAPGFFERGGLEAEVYFDTAVIIIALILLGRFLEARAKSQTSSAIKKLMGLRPKTARVRRDGGRLVLSARRVLRRRCHRGAARRGGAGGRRGA